MSEVIGNGESSMMSTNEGSKIPTPPNPLLIDLILDKLLALVNKADLPASRLVCKLWNLKIIPRFRMEFEICIQDGFYVGRQGKSLKKFVGLMRTSMNLPYTKFRLYLHNSSEMLVYEFFCKWGSEITHLTWENWKLDQSPCRYNIRRDYFFIGDLDDIIRFTPNLEYLCVHTPLIFEVPSSPGLCNSKLQLRALKMLLVRCRKNPGHHRNLHSNNQRIFEELRARSPTARIVIKYT